MNPTKILEWFGLTSLVDSILGVIAGAAIIYALAMGTKSLWKEKSLRGASKEIGVGLGVAFLCFSIIKIGDWLFTKVEGAGDNFDPDSLG